MSLLTGVKTFFDAFESGIFSLPLNDYLKNYYSKQ